MVATFPFQHCIEDTSTTGIDFSIAMLGKTHSSSSAKCLRTGCDSYQEDCLFERQGQGFKRNPIHRKSLQKVESFISKIFEPQKIIQQEKPNNPEISIISPFNFTTQPGCSLLPRLKFTARTSSFHRTHHKEPWHGVGHMTAKTRGKPVD